MHIGISYQNLCKNKEQNTMADIEHTVQVRFMVADIMTKGLVFKADGTDPIEQD